VTVIPVVVEDWQQSCCGAPFAIGNEVDWWLLFQDAATSDMPEEVPVELRLRSERDAASDRRVLRGAGLTAFASNGGSLPEGTFDACGFFYEDHHADCDPNLPTVHGTVRRIRQLARLYEQSDPGRGWDIIAGRVKLTDVARSEDPYAPGVRLVPETDASTAWLHVGWLVDLQAAEAGA
jgi:hypothetical protein